MINNNHKKSGCGFEEELVSYIYGETDAASKAKFEAHLAACSLCADELAAFSGVHFAIGDWKASEFSALASPVIEIPYPPKAAAVKESRLPAFLRDLFSSFSPRALSLATACVALLAFAFGAVLLLRNSPTVNHVAEANKVNRTAPVPTVEKTPETANVNSDGTPRIEQQKTDRSKPQPETVAQPETKNNRAVKVAQRPAPRTENANTPKSTDAKRPIKNKTTPEQAIPDDEEDDTLRLAELFEEIETRD